METIAVPDAAQPEVRRLYAAYALSRQDLAVFVNGLILGMGLSPDDWALDTRTMTLTPQQVAEVAKVANNGR